jgi:hypothetical protein
VHCTPARSIHYQTLALAHTHAFLYAGSLPAICIQAMPCKTCSAVLCTAHLLASTNITAASLHHICIYINTIINNRGDELSRRPAASAPPTLLHMHAGPLHPLNTNSNTNNSGNSSAAAAVQRTFSGHDLLGSSGTFLRPPSRPPSRPLSAPYSLGAQHHLLHDDSSGSSSNRLQLLHTGGNAKVSSSTDTAT